ncbi:MAG: sulfatase-like hydrolase/transferase [Planctomycetales bacterium]|nr:sulfatase-like hydrolase/transferase [Planctomycetales bacterium]
MYRMLFVGFLLFVLGYPAGADQTRPNILFILADDVGQEVLECYGGQSYPTPHLNELCRTGLKFNHAYSMPVCHPTRTTLMTGKYPVQLGNVKWGDFPKSEEASTLPNILRHGGYATGIAGKWQLCLMRDDLEHAQRLGFDTSDLFGWHEGPRYYEPMIYHNGKIRTDTLGHYGPDLYIRSIIDFMRENRDCPFFAFYSMAVSHDVTDDLDKPVPHGPFGRYGSYAEMVAEMDRGVGRLVGALNALKLREKTVIVFVADNGTPKKMIIRADGEKLVQVPVTSRRNGLDVPGGKGNLTNDGTSVPLIINWPGTVKPGQSTDQVVDFADFLPTFADLAGIELPEGKHVSGHSFAKMLTDPSAVQPKYAYCQDRATPLPGTVEPDRVESNTAWVRTADWKLYSDGRLFDMQSDPSEFHAVDQSHDSDERANVRVKLKRELDCILSSR